MGMSRWRPVSSRRIGAGASLVLVGLLLALRFGGGVPSDAGSAALSLSPDAGPYVVGVQAGETSDVVVLVGEGGAGEAVAIATVPHLPGYSSRGAVSPDGRYLALVVATSGTPSQPVAQLLRVTLANGEVRSLADGFPYLQTPVWSNDGRSVALTREPEPGTVLVVSVDIGGGERVLFRRERVAGVYPVGFAPDGTLYSVVIDQRGSVLLRGGEEVRVLSNGLTREWALSPDGRQLAFVEVIEGGKRFVGRVVPTEAGAVVAQAAQLEDGRQRRGMAWDPRTGRLLFAEDPGAGGGALAQGSQGIDLPVAFAPDGSALVVQHWSGSSFADPGQPSYQVLRAGTRYPLPLSRVFGWAAP